jgi:hypothetical protein
MSEKPVVKPGEWITIGKGHFGKSALVCNVYSDQAIADIEVVYLDDRDRAINDDVVWKEDHWEFKNPGPSGGYADKSSRLSQYVAQLRHGRYK